MCLVDEPGDRIDVTIGVIAFEPLVQPEDLLDAEIVPELVFEVSFTERRVAGRCQQALPRRNRDASAIHLERSAFHDDPRTVERTAVEDAGHMRGNVVIELGGIFAAPAVEFPIHEQELAVAGDEDWSAVAQPQILVRHAMHRDCLRGEAGARILLRLVVGNEQVHRFEPGDRVDQGGELAPHWLEHSNPLLVVVRPRHPRGGVRLPFSRHAKAELRRSLARGHVEGNWGRDKFQFLLIGLGKY